MIVCYIVIENSSVQNPPHVLRKGTGIVRMTARMMQLVTRRINGCAVGLKRAGTLRTYSTYSRHSMLARAQRYAMAALSIANHLTAYTLNSACYYIALQNRANSTPYAGSDRSFCQVDPTQSERSSTVSIRPAALNFPTTPAPSQCSPYHRSL